PSPSTTARFRKRACSASSTAIASRRPTRSSSGKRSTEISPTAPRSSWTSSSLRPRTSGGRCRGSGSCCRTATKDRAPSTRARGAFRLVLDDAGLSERAPVSRVILCSGKVYYDLAAARGERKNVSTAIVRVEQLYPFAEANLRETLAGYPAVRDVVWVQEESKNMRAWTFVQPLLSELRPAGTALWYAGRAPSASRSTGNASVHKRELAELLEDAFGAPGR